MEQTDDLYGRPTAAELLTAAREFLESEVMTATEGHVQFHTRVTLRVLDTVIRELELGPAHRARHTEMLNSLGYPSTWDLVGAIRSGTYDDRVGDLAAILRDDIRLQLEVSDPRYID